MFYVLFFLYCKITNKYLNMNVVVLQIIDYFQKKGAF